MTEANTNLMRERFKSYREPQKVQQAGVYPYYRAIESEQDAEVIMNGKKVLMFGSNSYLGLTNHPKVKEAAINAVKKYGSGCAGSRFLNGTLDIHIELENRLAEFVGKDEALVYSTGFQSNLGAIPTVTSRNDYVILDELDHASIIEGARLSFAKTLKFKHNNMHSLEKILKQCEPDRVKLIVVDGIFSMEGDIINLPEIVRLAEQYKANIMVDDAHSLGVIGKGGRGASSHFGLTDKVDIIMGTFSKSLASIGGFLASDSDTINYIKHNSRSLIFSASITPAATASALAALDIILSEPERIERLWDNTHFCLESLRNLGFDIGHTCSPIIPLMIRDNMKTFLFTKMAWEEGLFVNPVVSPAVRNESTLIRFSLMATHTRPQLETAMEKMQEIGRRLEIIK
ncbi:MAG: pyridoxal phosphate-dependent aminotransferase family protein [Bacteroidales bacterium]|nr:pyridoxal phosphate-dependent aminotransferase family protein [Bacteroidales bacterium]MCL2133367.1 pyridoxal phosphate-dependent aminotransferase family protein [Bacteroidales bacterium]